MYVRKSPCYKCELRTIGCHTNCDKYKDWKAEMNELSQNAFKSKYYIDNRVNNKHHAKCGVYSTRKK